MHPHELQQLLTERGYVLLRTRGSHQRWRHTATGACLTVSVTSHANSRRLLAIIERRSRRREAAA
jgi:predicted RNA binding protein YcfA (HicA-like mRNA interferase family)